MARRRRRPARGGPAVTALVRELAALLSELDLTEVEVALGGVRVRLQRRGAAAPPSPAAPAAFAAPPTPAAVAPVVAEVEPAAGITIEAPMVGTFYRAPSPNAEPYVHEGDVVKEGQILCVIEAMKLMNEIESKAAGRVLKILVENGHGVEYGQPLFLIAPAR